jgi:Spx/MgsR family transcriptional regulator
MTTLYGIKNCDTIKKARRWLEQNKVEYRFHDVRTDGISRPEIQDWLKTLDWETLLNRRGSSWRKLPESVRDNISKSGAIDLMLENPAIIKRPVLAHNNTLCLGFSAHSYQSIFRMQTAT